MCTYQRQHQKQLLSIFYFVFLVFDFKSDILDKAVLIKTFDLREGSVLGNYIHNYVEQEGFEFDKSMYVNFSNAEVTYYGINKNNGVLEKRVESFFVR